MLASMNNDRQANFAHGFLLHEGKYIKRDIEGAVHYYKESSSFNNQYSKNNLGIIYKHGFEDKIKSRIGNAIEFFKEAIHQKNDYLSMYNLAHIYIYESIKQDEDESIKLLIKSSTQFEHSLILLSIVLVKRYGEDVSSIQQTIEKYDKGSKITSHINEIIFHLDLFNKYNHNYYFEMYKKIDFLYDVELNPILTEDVQNANQKVIIPKYPKAKNITQMFYEGFGIDLTWNKEY